MSQPTARVSGDPRRLSVHRQVGRALSEQGIEQLFGVMGDANMRYIVSYVEEHHGKYAGAAHEAGAVGMADGYARMSARPSVVSVTHGPGLTNGMTALVEAVKARTPLVVITGDTSSSRRGQLQWLDLAAVAASSGAGYYRCRKADEAVDDVGHALRQAAIESRPVVLDLPADIMNEEGEYRSSGVTAMPSPPVRPPETQVDRALGIIAWSARPVIVAGRGAVTAGARDAIVALADATGALLATTVAARGLFADHPANLGICGTASSPAAIKAVSEADCVVAFGASLNAYTTDNGRLFGASRVVQVDSDAGAIGRYLQPHAHVLADARLTAEAFVDALADAGLPARAPSARAHPAAGSQQPHADFTDTSRPGAVDVRTALLTLNELLPTDYALVCDAGRFMLPTWRYLRVPRPARTATASYGGSIGLALGVALGSAFADSTHPTVCVLGDGGAMMSLMELDTAVRYALPVVIVLVNDSSYGVEFRALQRHGLDPRHSLFRRPNFSDLGRALGARALRVDSPQALYGLTKADLAPVAGPVVLEIVADPAVDTW